jgi:hypothetical protein
MVNLLVFDIAMCKFGYLWSWGLRKSRVLRNGNLLAFDIAMCKFGLLFERFWILLDALGSPTKW